MGQNSFLKIYTIFTEKYLSETAYPQFSYAFKCFGRFYSRHIRRKKRMGDHGFFSLTGPHI